MALDPNETKLIIPIIATIFKVEWERPQPGTCLMLISQKKYLLKDSKQIAVKVLSLVRSWDSFKAQNSLIKFKTRFNRISRRILLCDYVTLNPAVTLSLFPEGSKEAFHTYFHPGTHFTFILRCISTSWLWGLYSGLYCILYLEGGGTIFICKIILPEVISATWSLSLSSSALGEIIHFLGPGSVHILSGWG